MFAVVFKAEIKKLDKEYFETVKILRKLAFEEYGLIDIESKTEGKYEVTVTYWPTLEHIKRWKQNPHHQKAIKNAHKWYNSYKIEISEF